jgi:anti-sigma factor RsiW
MRQEHGERSHQRVWELLPWYINGSLEPGERERVEAHLATCSRCREEAGLCQRTAEEIAGAGEVSPSPHPVQFQRLLARIDESEREAEALPEAGRPLLAPVRSLVRATPRPFRWVMVAQAAAIFLLAGLLALRAQRPGAGSPAAPAAPYRTLSNPEPAPVPSVRLRVMFQPKATEREIRDLLHGVSGEITAGPSPSGAYTIDVPATRDPVGVVLARLRSEPQLVMLAEPVAGGAETSAR